MKKKSISQLKRVEFRNELSDKAYDAYRLSDVEFYIDRDGTYYFGENGKITSEEFQKLGKIILDK